MPSSFFLPLHAPTNVKICDDKLGRKTALCRCMQMIIHFSEGHKFEVRPSCAGMFYKLVDDATEAYLQGKCLPIDFEPLRLAFF